jgi:hypothetical protein
LYFFRPYVPTVPSTHDQPNPFAVGTAFTGTGMQPLLTLPFKGGEKNWVGEDEQGFSSHIVLSIITVTISIMIRDAVILFL